MLSTKKWRLLTVVLVVALVSVSTIPFYSPQYNVVTSTEPDATNSPPLSGLVDENATSYETDNSTNITSPTPTPSTPRPTPKPTPPPPPQSNIAFNANPTPNPSEEYTIIATPIPNEPISIDNSREMQSAINALGPSGGEVILYSDATLSSIDVQVTSNIVFSGVNPAITLHLNTSRLNVAKNAVNVTIRDLVIDATNLGDRNTLAVYAGAQNVSIINVTIQNSTTKNNSLITLGNYVLIQNLTFTNVQNSHPIHIGGSHTYIKNCRSSDTSTFALLTVSGGITDVRFENNLAENRPLFDGGYTKVPSTDIWILNNTLINFPRQTYGILVMGGSADPIVAPFDKVFVLGNSIKAGSGAYNAIAIYGLSSNVLVANNTVDQTLSGHNAIGVASGVNVTVTQNTVFGCVEGKEGGIEVESNPIHNRYIGISENVNVTNNIIYGSQWGIYVRIMVPDHPNWGGNPIKSKNILIEGNTVSNCTIGINLLHGENITVKNNYISDNTKPFTVDQSNVINYKVSGNVGYEG